MSCRFPGMVRAYLSMSLVCWRDIEDEEVVKAESRGREAVK